MRNLYLKPTLKDWHRDQELPLQDNLGDLLKMKFQKN